MAGVRESDTGLAHPSRWDLVSDKQAMQEEQPLQARREGGSRSTELAAGAALAAPRGRVSLHSQPPPTAARVLHCCRWRAAPRSSTPAARRPSM